MFIKKILQKIFKKLGHSIFFLIYGKINGVIDPANNKEIIIQKITIDKNIYKIFSVLNGVLYTNRIHDTAIILKDKIVDGPSFQYRYYKGNNSIVKSNENIIFKTGTPRIKRKLKGNVLSLLTGGGGNDNYFHWLFDVLPRLGIIEKNMSLDKIDYFILPNMAHKFQLQTLDLLKIPEDKRLSSVVFRHISANNLISTTHPYVVKDPVLDIQTIPGWISEWLKGKFWNKSDNTQYPKNIYIEREKNNNNLNGRSIINEKEVKDFLLSKNFQPVMLKELNFINQVQLFRQANFVAGLHGAGFANLAFCNKDTQILEIKSSTTDNLYKNIAFKNNLNYDSIVVKPENIEANNQQGNIRVSIEELKNKIN